MSDLALLKRQAAAYLPKPALRELETQIRQTTHVGSLAQAASSENARAVGRVAREVAAAVAAAERTLDRADRLTPAQQRELETQVDLVLERNRVYLALAHDRAIDAIHAAGREPARGETDGDRFLRGFTLGAWDGIRNGRRS